MAARTRNILVALPRDAAEAAATLSWVRGNLAREDDSTMTSFTLLHVRRADLTAAQAAPFAPVEEPVNSLLDDCLLGADEESGKAAMRAAQALGSNARLVKLRSSLPIIDALMAYVTQFSGADALVMGSHTAAKDAAAWYVHERHGHHPQLLTCSYCRRMASHTTTDVAALSPVPVFIVRSAAQAAAAAAPAQAPSDARFVVIAVDGRAPSSSLLVRWATSNILRSNDTVLLCHKPTGEHEKDAAAEVDKCSAMLRDFVAPGGGTAITDAAFTSAFDVRDALVDLAQSGVAGIAGGPPSLMVLASRGPSALKRAALGSVSSYVVQHAACSLALVPPPALLAHQVAT